MSTVRTRIAPSPTGEDLHIGNAYTALINFLVAKKNKGQFIIRIEDTDRTRFVEGSQERILASLAWLGIHHDEGPDVSGPFSPYVQSKRLDLYKKHADELVSGGHAYYCFCTSERLDAMRKEQELNHKPPMYDGLCKTLDPYKSHERVKAGESFVIRLRVPDSGTTTFHDEIRGDISFENILIDDQVLIKSDGYPTYHLGVVVDDHLMEISHIIRGEEWISSTPKHILLYQFFGWQLPVFAHVPLLRNPDKSKLSKRKNPVWASWFRKEGFLPEAMINYLATMAWSHPEGKELFTLDEMIDKFSLDRIVTTAPVFDIEKLKWFNKQYLMQKSVSSFATLASGTSVYYGKNQNFQSIASGTATLIQSRIATLTEYDSMAGFFFERPKEYEQPLKKDLVALVKTALASCNWNHEIMEKVIREVAAKEGIPAKELFMELRIAVTGKTVGPPLLESLEILGKEETLARLSSI